MPDENGEKDCICEEVDTDKKKKVNDFSSNYNAEFSVDLCDVQNSVPVETYDETLFMGNIERTNPTIRGNKCSTSSLRFMSQGTESYVSYDTALEHQFASIGNDDFVDAAIVMAPLSLEQELFEFAREINNANYHRSEKNGNKNIDGSCDDGIDDSLPLSPSEIYQDKEKKPQTSADICSKCW